MKKIITAFLILNSVVINTAFAKTTTQQVPKTSSTQQTQGSQASQASTLNKTPDLPKDGFMLFPAYPNTIEPKHFLFEIKPGGSAEDYAVIQNFSSSPSHFSLYGSDPTISNQGTLAYKTHSQTTAEGTWVQFYQPEIDLAPNGNALVKFKVTIPKDATLGEHKIGITIEKSGPENNGITIATRVVINAKVTVTMNPKPIPHEQNPDISFNPKPVWQKWFFWISLILFIVSAGSLIYVNLNDKKKRR